MPCDSGGGNYGPSYNDLRDVEKKLRMVEAILCGLIRATGGGPNFDHNLKVLFAKVDWEEAGVTPAQAYEWWKNHLLKDSERNTK